MSMYVYSENSMLGQWERVEESQRQMREQADQQYTNLIAGEQVAQRELRERQELARAKREFSYTPDETRLQREQLKNNSSRPINLRSKLKGLFGPIKKRLC